MVVIGVLNDYDSVLEIPMKTEFITMLQKKVKAKTGQNLKIVFNDT